MSPLFEAVTNSVTPSYRVRAKEEVGISVQRRSRGSFTWVVPKARREPICPLFPNIFKYLKKPLDSVITCLLILRSLFAQAAKFNLDSYLKSYENCTSI